LGVGAYTLRRSLSSRYVLAQRIDKRLGLADALSTAFHFSENPRPDRAAVCDRQRLDAYSIADRVDVKQALPFHRSRYLAPAVALAAVAFGLFGARYLLLGTIDLKASLVRAVYDNFFNTKPTEARNQDPKRARFDRQTGAPNPDVPSLDSDRQPEDLLNPDQSNDANNPEGDNSGNEKGSQKGKDGKDSKDGKDGKGGDQGKQDDSAQAKNSSDQDGKEGADDKKGSNQDGKQNGKASSGQKSESMLDKMKNALSDLADKIKQTAEGSKGDQSPPPNNPGEKSDDGKKGDQNKDQQSQSSNGQQAGQQGQDQQSDAQSNQKASEQAKGQDSKSGIGAQDGSKAIKQAEELQAMGKISELLGKRSAAVTGEVMVEVGSSKQQLKTQWSQQQANHTGAGGEIHRDEVPLAEQPFIEKYFEEIRKTAPPAVKKDG
jgi:hypothetical protein